MSIETRPAGVAQHRYANPCEGRAAARTEPTCEGVEREPGEVDLLAAFESAAPVRFRGSAVSGLTQHTFATVGEDRDPDVRNGLMVFSSTRHSNHANLYLRRLDGGAVVQLTNDEFSNIQPAFSPDGRRVAYACNRNGNWDIYVLALDGGETVQVTDTEDQEVHPTWSPDGSRLAYSCLSGRSGEWEIFSVAADGSDRQRVLITEGLFPVWSRTGRLAFQRARRRGEPWFSIWTVTLDGDRVSRPAEVAGGAEWAAIAPAWSPDGSRLVFAAVNRDRRSASSPGVPHADSLWMARADGSELIRLTPVGERVSAPAWGDDGRIYFVSDRSGRHHVWSLEPVASPGGAGVRGQATAAVTGRPVAE